MKREIDPHDTTRGMAFDLWMQSPMPMVTITKTFDVTRVRKISRRKGIKFNELLTWCIGKAAQNIQEFYTIPDPIENKMFHYDALSIQVIVKNKQGSISFCDIKFYEDFGDFRKEYVERTARAYETCQHQLYEDYAIIATSAVIQTELDSIVNQYTGSFVVPFVVWAKYHRGFFKTTLPINFQFHHVQMDGEAAATFFNNLQREFDQIKYLF